MSRTFDQWFNKNEQYLAEEMSNEEMWQEYEDSLANQGDWLRDQQKDRELMALYDAESSSEAS